MQAQSNPLLGQQYPPPSQQYAPPPQGQRPPQQQASGLTNQRKLVIFFLCVLVVVGIIMMAAGGSSCGSGCDSGGCTAYDGTYYDCTCGDYCENKSFGGVGVGGLIIFLVGLITLMIVCIRVYRERRLIALPYQAVYDYDGQYVAAPVVYQPIYANQPPQYYSQSPYQPPPNANTTANPNTTTSQYPSNFQARPQGEF